MTAPTNDREWFNAIDSLGAAIGAALLADDTARVEQLRAERNQLQSRRAAAATTR